MFSDGARSESRAFGRRGGRPSRGGKCGHRDDVPPTEMKSQLCSFGLPPTHFIRYPDGGAQKHLRTVVLRHPSPPLIRRAIQISRFLTTVVGGFLGDRVELHRLAVERFPLTAGAAPRFGGNIRSEGKLTL